MTATKTIRFIDHRQLADGRIVRAGEELALPAGEAADHVRNGVAEHVSGRDQPAAIVEDPKD